MTPHLRIENDGFLGHHTRVFHVDRDGSETEISDVVSEIRIKVGELNTVTFASPLVKFRLKAMRRTRRQVATLRWRRGRIRIRCKAHDVTALGSKARAYLPGLRR